MGLRNKSIQFIRRLSVFYLLLIVLIACFGLYYFNYVPNNKNALNQWGQRSLNQLATNFTKRGADVRSIFDSAILSSLQKKEGSYRYLNSNIAYNLDKISLDSAGRAAWRKNPVPFMGKDRAEQWCIQYHADSLAGDSGVYIRVKDFISPLLEGRDDIFDRYMLFRDTDKGTQGKPINLEVLYRDEQLSSSAMINADTLLRSQKNSDLSGVVELTISGTVYEVFIRPFDFYQQHMYLAGLISKTNYEKSAQSTPLNFIPYSIVLFLVIFISMPFLKIYLLSPKERINAGDVLTAALSFFVGSSIFVLVLFYLFITFFTKVTFNHRLDKFGKELHADITSELRLANDQLWKYDSIYSRLDDSAKKVLVYRNTSDSIKNSVNTAFTPTSYFNISRVFWIDNAGNTIAKWNPFNFDARLSSVKTAEFFRILQRQTPTDSSFVSSDRNVIYSGKSNVTGEFQVYLAKPLRRLIADTGGHPVNSLAITMALFPNSSIRPVIPAGFGFCVIDREGRILMDADEHRNLTENLLEETGDNAQLAHSIQYKSEAIIDNIILYGQICQMKVLPLHGQPLSVVVYYNRRLLTNNILRLLHFTMETLLYIFLGLGACVFISGLSSFFTSTRLRFRLYKMEWVRYSTANRNAYAFTRVYYWYLTVLTTALFLVIQLAGLDMRTLFYTSLVLPFYAVWAFIFSGLGAIPGSLEKCKKYVTSFLKTESSVLVAASSILFCLILINCLLFPYYKNDFHFRTGSIWLFFLFQALAILGLLVTRPLARKKEMAQKIKERKGTNKRLNERDFSRPNYIVSLCFAIVLIGVLPTLGVLTYGFYSEKIQYKKNKLLKIAEDAEQRDFYLTTKVLPAYKPVVRARLATHSYFDSLLFQSGMYLTEKDSAIYSPLPPASHPVHPVAAADKAPVHKIAANSSVTAIRDTASTHPIAANSSVPPTHDTKSALLAADNSSVPEAPDTIALHAVSATASLPADTTPSQSVALAAGSRPSPAANTVQGSFPTPTPRNTELADEPYAHFMDHRFIRTSQEYDSYSITGNADDSSWQFYTTHDMHDWINLSYRNRVAERRGYQFLARSSIQNPLIDFINLPFFGVILFALLTLILIVGFNWLIKGTADRLFLFRFAREHDPDRGDNLLVKFLGHPDCRPKIPATGPNLYKGFMELTAPEFSTDLSVKDRETLILSHESRFATLYDCIWNTLPAEEQFILYDFCLDGYTNYKNKEILNKLMDKGILLLMDDAFKPFSLSFRNHILSKKDSPAFNKIIAAGNTGGAWTALRIPILTIVAVIAIFTAFTQSDFTNKLTAFLTSLLALFPLVLKFLENFRAGNTAPAGSPAPSDKAASPPGGSPSDAGKTTSAKGGPSSHDDEHAPLDL